MAWAWHAHDVTLHTADFRKTLQCSKLMQTILTKAMNEDDDCKRLALIAIFVMS